MAQNDKGGVSVGSTPNQTSVVSTPKDKLPPAVEKDMTLGKSTDADNEAAVLSREKSATVREDAAQAREDAADVREGAVHEREDAAEIREEVAQERKGAATSREREIRAAEAQAASADHLLMLQEANAHLVVATIEAQKLAEQVKTSQGALDHLAHHDVLTDLPNRILLQDRLHHAIELAPRQSNQLAVLFMDLDQFKHINDSLGHRVGDQLLQIVARRLVDCVLHSDTISRHGGDEFVVLLPKIEQPQDAALAAQKMLDTIAQPYRIGELDLHIGGSIGISIYPKMAGM